MFPTVSGNLSGKIQVKEPYTQRPAKYLNHRGMPKQTDGYPVFLKPIGICFKHLQPLGPDLLKIRDQNCPHMIWIL